MVKLLLKLVLCISCSMTVANASEYFVAKNGNDSSNGSEINPWLTVQKAANTVHGGDIVYIKNGVYYEKVSVQNSGSAGSYITFKEYPGHSVILDGTGNAGWHGVFSIYGKDYIKLDGIEIRNNSTGWGVLIEHEQNNVNNAATYIELTDLQVHHTGGEAIQVRGNAHDILLQNCVVHDATNPSGIDIYQWGGGRPHHVTVRGCIAYNYPSFAGIASEQADNLIIENNTTYNSELGIDIGSGDHNIVRNNTIRDCSNGIAISSNEDSEIYNNIIHDIYDEAFCNYYWSAHGEAHAMNKYHNNVIYNAGFGIYESNQRNTTKREGLTSDHEYSNNLFYNIGTHGSYRTPFYFKGAIRTKFYNNTIYMNAGYDAIEFLDSATNADVRNNIISVSGSKLAIIMDSSSSSGSVIDYNCYHNRTGSVTGPGVHSVIGDPKFVDSANKIFRLKTGSPCIDAGSSNGNVPLTDIEGYSRCDDSSTANTGGGLNPYYDIGAYEYPCMKRLSRQNNLRIK